MLADSRKPRKDPRKKNERTPASWLLQGLLSNPVPIIGSNDHYHGVPELPMLVVHRWLVTEWEDQIPDMLPFIHNMWMESRLFFNQPLKSMWKRFEGVMSYWFASVLCCSKNCKRQLSVCTDMRDCTALFPGFGMETFVIKETTAIVLGIPKFTPLVIKIPHKISGEAAGGITKSFSCNGKPSVFVCQHGEDAIDLILCVGGRIILLQLKMYTEAVGQAGLETMLLNLRKFRGKLWKYGASDDANTAQVLGLPCIHEKDVVFVLLATAGLTGTGTAVQKNRHTGVI